MEEHPKVGGDTAWVSGYGLYDELSPNMQRLLEELHAVHTSRFQYDTTIVSENPSVVVFTLPTSDLVPLAYCLCSYSLKYLASSRWRRDCCNQNKLNKKVNN